MLDILKDWNRWGDNPLPSGLLRKVTAQVCDLIDMPEIVVLTGLRHAGKTTVLYQVMDFLEKQGVDPKAMLHVNFEDPGFSNALTEDLLDEVYRVYREEVYSEGLAYLFLDEIQEVPAWEKWVNARNETENIKIFVSGSSAHLMSWELATLLTGRHIEIQVHPLNFREYLEFEGVALPKAPMPYRPSSAIQQCLKKYMQWGALPRVVLASNDIKKKLLLQGYLQDILFKDIALRHNIRDMVTLRNLCVYLFTQTGGLLSYKRLANVFQVSQDLIQNYCGYIEESYLINFLPFYSLKMAEQNRNPKKIHVTDLGFRQIANMSHSLDFGKLAETVVYNMLAQKENEDIFYWKQKGEIDLLSRSGIEVKNIIQVVYEGLDKESTFQREMAALQEAHQKLPNATKTLVSAVVPKNLPPLPDYVRVEPLWRFLLGV